MNNFGRWIRNFTWGEAALWALFILVGSNAASEGNDTTMTFAGLSLLAAIGVRATRLPKVKNNDPV